MSKRFTDQVVIVTGASRGIGQAAAVAFARENARVIVNYHRDEAGAQETLAQIEALGGRATLLRADLGQLVEIDRLVQMVESEIGPIRILVNNAAAFNRDPFLDVTVEELDRVWATNVRGLFYLSQQTARRMARRRQGCLVHVSSIGARLAVASRTVYLASKGAIESLTRAMALDLAPYDIRVNAVVPGLIRTEGLLASLPDPARQAALEAYIPGKRFGEPGEVAEVIVFLASEGARYVNGALVAVDGGMGAREAGFPFSPRQEYVGETDG
jgi:NAD(P)-dependent dehydrogenase (short-subunit alcohol dehydrogenase family)